MDLVENNSCDVKKVNTIETPVEESATEHLKNTEEQNESKQESKIIVKEEETVTIKSEELESETVQNGDNLELPSISVDKTINQEINGNKVSSQNPELGTKTTEITDEYHYTQSGEYTSEMFKVVVQNIPGKVSYGVSILFYLYLLFVNIILQRR